jgi:electron-transferring-flavoprotein dehydrogenase
MVGMDQVIFRGKAPWTLAHAHADHETLRPKSESTPIAYPKPGRRPHVRSPLVGLRLEHQPRGRPARAPHAQGCAGADHGEPRALRRARAALLPRGVYEIVTEAGKPRLQINAQNCVHCKTCDIKDPMQNIRWVVPEGGGGPNYPNM